MKIRETVNQIKNEFLFNANDFMSRVDCTQQLITWQRGWKIKETVAPNHPEIFLMYNLRPPSKISYYAMNRNKPFFVRADNCEIPFPKGTVEDCYFVQEKDTGKLMMRFLDGVAAKYKGKWTCRHYAMMDILLRYKGLKGPHSVKRAQLFTDGERMKELIWERPHNATWLGLTCTGGATDRYWVEMTGKTDFLYEICKRQPLPALGEKIFLPMYVSSCAHAMTLTLKIAHRKDGTVQYSVTWYDPNMTYNHRKIRFDNLEDLRAFEWDRLIPKEIIAGYRSFGADNNPDDRPITWIFSPMKEGKIEEIVERLEWSDHRRHVAYLKSREETFPLIKEEKKDEKKVK